MATGGKRAIGRFFVTQTQTQTQSSEESELRQNVDSGNSWKPHYGFKKGKKKFVSIPYPEATIQEETSPTDGDDDKEADITAANNPANDQENGKSGMRPRSGTWGIATSRKYKMKEELQGARQRRKSGDDVLNVTKEKEKKKDASFREVFRPRSKSDAAQKAKKMNIISNMKNVLQQTLISPSQSGSSGRNSGQKSGSVTPVEHSTKNDVYHTWHAGAAPLYKTKTADSPKTKWWQEIFQTGKNRGETNDDMGRKKGDDVGRKKGANKHPNDRMLTRRQSMESDRRHRSNSGGGMANIYIRGELDPNIVQNKFRESRGLPASGSFFESTKRSDLEKNESQIIVKFFQYHQCYDLIPTSAKLVIFDTRLPVKKAFHALVFNGVRAAPLWDSGIQKFVGMLTITDFIRILQTLHNSPDRKMEELESHRLEMWKSILNDGDRPLISVAPEDKLYVAIRLLIHHKIHRLPVIERITGNALYIITHKRILKFLYLYISDLPKPLLLQKTLRELNLGSYSNIQTATEDTLIIEALDSFVKHRISALPIIDKQGKLINIYAKFDVINLAAEGTYSHLNVTLREANKKRNEWFEGVQKCTLDETLSTIMERLVRTEVHRLVVIDSTEKVIGVVSLSDILRELVLRPCGDHDPNGLFEVPVDQVFDLDEKLKINKNLSSDPLPNMSTFDGVTLDATTPEQNNFDYTFNGVSVADKEAVEEESCIANNADDIIQIMG